MPQIIKTTVYEFSELSDEAKGKALQWMRNNTAFYLDHVIEDAKEAASYLGIDVDKIYYSGFYSQGDGACFVGKFDSSKCESIQTIDELYSADKYIQNLAGRISKLENITAKITHSGRYYHAYSMDFDIENDNNRGEYVGDDVENEVEEILREFAKWTYYNLVKEYDWQMSDECLAEEIEANEYTFTADGVRFG